MPLVCNSPISKTPLFEDSPLRVNAPKAARGAVPFRVGEGGEKTRIPVRAAGVLRRAGILAGEADRVPCVRLGRADLLDHDLVLPPVAEVVDVR